MPSAGDYVRASDIPGDVGCRLRRAANQSVNDSAATAISWDTEDVDTSGFITVTSSTITIPTGLGGLYAITFQAGGAVANLADLIIDPTSGVTGMPTDFLNPMDVARDRGVLAVTIPLLAADTFNCQVFHTTGAPVNFTAWLPCYRIAVL
jgi:hypothetical protein